MHVYTYVGAETTEPGAGRGYFAPIGGEGSGLFRVPAGTLLFRATRGAPERFRDGGVLIDNVVSDHSKTRVPLYTTFHAAVASLAMMPRLASATLYLLEAREDLEVQTRRPRSHPIKNSPLPGSSWNFAQAPSAMQLTIAPAQNTRLRVYRALELPVQPYSAQQTSFPPGLFTNDPRDGTAPPPFNLHEALTQWPTSLQRTLHENLANLGAPVKDKTLAYHAALDVLRFDAGSQFPGAQRLLADRSGSFSCAYMHPCDVAGDHERLLRLCHLSDGDATTDAASRFAVARGVGPWPNRIALWIEPTRAPRAAEGSVRARTVVHRVGQAPLVRDLRSRRREGGCGFVVFEAQLDASAGTATATIIAAESASAHASARHLEFALLKATSTLTFASTTHGDGVRKYYEAYYSAGGAVSAALARDGQGPDTPVTAGNALPSALEEAMALLHTFSFPGADTEELTALVKRPHLSVESVAAAPAGQGGARAGIKRLRGPLDDDDDDGGAATRKPQPFLDHDMKNMQTLQAFF